MTEWLEIIGGGKDDDINNMIFQLSEQLSSFNKPVIQDYTYLVSSIIYLHAHLTSQVQEVAKSNGLSDDPKGTLAKGPLLFAQLLLTLAGAIDKIRGVADRYMDELRRDAASPFIAQAYQGPHDKSETEFTSAVYLETGHEYRSAQHLTEFQNEDLIGKGPYGSQPGKVFEQKGYLHQAIPPQQDMYRPLPPTSHRSPSHSISRVLPLLQGRQKSPSERVLRKLHSSSSPRSKRHVVGKRRLMAHHRGRRKRYRLKMKSNTGKDKKKGKKLKHGRKSRQRKKERKSHCVTKCADSSNGKGEGDNGKGGAVGGKGDANGGDGKDGDGKDGDGKDGDGGGGGSGQNGGVDRGGGGCGGQSGGDDRGDGGGNNGGDGEGGDEQRNKMSVKDFIEKYSITFSKSFRLITNARGLGDEGPRTRKEELGTNLTQPPFLPPLSHHVHIYIYIYLYI